MVIDLVIFYYGFMGKGVGFIGWGGIFLVINVYL